MNEILLLDDDVELFFDVHFAGFRDAVPNPEVVG